MTLALDSRNLITPRELPDGSIQWCEHSDIAWKLVHGDPTLGWEGDPSLSLVCETEHDYGDHLGPQWQVWQRCRDGQARLILTAEGRRLPGPELILKLVAHDTRRVNVAAMIDGIQAEHRRRRDQEYDEVIEENARRLHFALTKDLSMPMADGRMYPLR